MSFFRERFSQRDRYPDGFNHHKQERVARGNQFKRADEYAVFCFLAPPRRAKWTRRLYSVEFGELEEKVAAEGRSQCRSHRKAESLLSHLYR